MKKESSNEPIINLLTAEQVSKFPYYVDKWVRIGLSVEPTDFDAAIRAAKEVYKISGLKCPQMFLGPFNNPVEGLLAYEELKKLKGQSFKSSKIINQQIRKAVEQRIENKSFPENLMSLYVFGNQEYWLSFYDYFQNECGLSCCDELNGLKNMAMVGGWWIPLKNACIFIHRPRKITRDAQNRLHNDTEAAIEFPNSDIGNVYAIHGVRITKKVMDREYTVDDIFKETNAEIRRIMISRYKGNFALDSGAKIVSQDDFGTLYKRDIPGDEPVMYVKVLNSTPEEDGSFKDYWLRVDPNAYGGLTTAQAAVASTWRRRVTNELIFSDPKDYDPEIQT